MQTAVRCQCIRGQRLQTVGVVGPVGNTYETFMQERDKIPRRLESLPRGGSLQESDVGGTHHVDPQR